MPAPIPRRSPTARSSATRVLDRLSAPVEAPAEGRAVSAWATPYGAWGKVDGDDNAAKLDRDSQGALMGMEAANTDGLRLGVALGIGHGSADVDARRFVQRNRTPPRSWPMARRGSAVSPCAAAWASADISIDTLRTVAIRNFSETLSGKVDGQVTQAFAEVGYALSLGKMSVEPIAGLATLRFKADGFNETGRRDGPDRAQHQASTPPSRRSACAAKAPSARARPCS